MKIIIRPLVEIEPLKIIVRTSKKGNADYIERKEDRMSKLGKWFRRWICKKFHRRRWVYVNNKDYWKTGEIKQICSKCGLEWYKM